MKILILSTYDNQGGAARAAYRIHNMLRSRGLESTMMVQYKNIDDHSVIGPSSKTAKVINRLRPILDNLPLKLYKKRQKQVWSVGWLPKNIERQITPLNVDIINLHWICKGFLPSSAILKLKKPLIWTLQDCWAFTGGCHYPFECTKYQKNCGSCPQLGSKKEHDLSRLVWNRKSKYWGNSKITAVAISHWMAECAQSSSLFRNVRIEVIPNGLDISVYKPIEKRLAREILNLPHEKTLILFGAIDALDPRKGFNLLCSSLEKLNPARFGKSIDLIVFGTLSQTLATRPDFPGHYFGYLHDDFSMALLYSACDVMMVPSIQEAFGQTASEAMACGTPVVAFNSGGLRDIVDHQKNGYLAQPFDPQDLAHGIEWVLSDDARNQRLRKAARAKAEREFSISRVADRYLSLYEEILRKH
jgi:glycosyltransferase involved in cell wall biosynthesis